MVYEGNGREGCVREREWADGDGSNDTVEDERTKNNEVKETGRVMKEIQRREGKGTERKKNTIMILTAKVSDKMGEKNKEGEETKVKKEKGEG